MEHRDDVPIVEFAHVTQFHCAPVAMRFVNPMSQQKFSGPLDRSLHLPGPLLPRDLSLGPQRLDGPHEQAVWSLDPPMFTIPTPRLHLHYRRPASSLLT